MQLNDIADTIGSKVRAGRARLGLTRKQLALKAEVSERYLHELENGGANASLGIIAKVAEALNETPLGLMTEGASPDHAFADRSGLEFKALLPIRAISQELLLVLQSMSQQEQVALVPVVRRWAAERRRLAKGVALLGLRGAGKTTLGRLLAERHDMRFVSITREIEARAGMGLNDLFNLGGPEAYRSLENDVVRDLIASGDRVVLETAGGIVGNSEALDMILGAFKTVWLKASPEEHLARVSGQGDTRPMHGNPRALDHLKALLSAREPEYARAELVIDTAGRTIGESLAELEAHVGAAATATAGVLG